MFHYRKLAAHWAILKLVRLTVVSCEDCDDETRSGGPASALMTAICFSSGSLFAIERGSKLRIQIKDVIGEESSQDVVAEESTLWCQ